MIEDEKVSIYEPYSLFPGSKQLFIISLKECQGFVFNQNLFATPYQQLRSAEKEKRLRALSYSRPRSKSIGGKEQEPARVRRHTSHEFQTPFMWGQKSREVAVEDDQMDVDDGRVEIPPKAQVFDNDDIEEEEEEEEEEDEEDEDNSLDEYDDYEETEFGLYGAVQVTDIIVEESDHDYIPGKD